MKILTVPSDRVTSENLTAEHYLRQDRRQALFAAVSEAIGFDDRRTEAAKYLAAGGARVGVPGITTYYEESSKFYHEHHDIIWDILNELAGRNSNHNALEYLSEQLSSEFTIAGDEMMKAHIVNVVVDDTLNWIASGVEPGVKP